ncbi:MAG: ATP synthase subunit I [Saprospiraceae bacterium]|nr:ATP synthase subunit I [Saprospiraceae bacterium]
MNEWMAYVLSILTGGALGWFYFQILWWTTQKGLHAKQPLIWFLGSSILRTVVVLAGIWLVSGGHWQRILLSLLGFVLVRIYLVRYHTRQSNTKSG